MSSVSFFISFERLKLQSKFVNHIAKSTLALLLGHSVIMFLYHMPFKNLLNNYKGFQLAVCWILTIFLFFCVIIIVDQVRLFLFGFVEKMMSRIIKKDEIYCL